MDESEKAALEFFSPYFDRFIACKNKVNRRFLEIIKVEHQHRIVSRSYSSVLNDLMVDALVEEFADLLNTVKPLRKYAQTTFLYEGDASYHMKCKKMDRRFKLSFVQTQLSLNFFDSNVQLQFQNMLSRLANIVLGYKMNPINTEIEDLFLAWPEGANNFRWIHKVEPIAGIELQTPELIPIAPSSDGRQVKPKKSA